MDRKNRTLYIALLLCTLHLTSAASEKQTKLEDIELDNLRSEMEKDDSLQTQQTQHLRPPSVAASNGFSYAAQPRGGGGEIEVTEDQEPEVPRGYLPVKQEQQYVYVPQPQSQYLQTQQPRTQYVPAKTHQPQYQQAQYEEPQQDIKYVHQQQPQQQYVQYYVQPSAQQTHSYAQTSQLYSQPAQSYDIQPSQGYALPTQSYRQLSYVQPALQYGAPSPSYALQTRAYSIPAQVYAQLQEYGLAKLGIQYSGPQSQLQQQYVAPQQYIEPQQQVQQYVSPQPQLQQYIAPQLQVQQQYALPQIQTSLGYSQQGHEPQSLLDSYVPSSVTIARLRQLQGGHAGGTDYNTISYSAQPQSYHAYKRTTKRRV